MGIFNYYGKSGPVPLLPIIWFFRLLIIARNELIILRAYVLGFPGRKVHYNVSIYRCEIVALFSYVLKQLELIRYFLEFPWEVLNRAEANLSCWEFNTWQIWQSIVIRITLNHQVVKENFSSLVKIWSFDPPNCCVGGGLFLSAFCHYRQYRVIYQFYGSNVWIVINIYVVIHSWSTPAPYKTIHGDSTYGFVLQSEIEMENKTEMPLLL